MPTLSINLMKSDSPAIREIVGPVEVTVTGIDVKLTDVPDQIGQAVRHALGRVFRLEAAVDLDQQLKTKESQEALQKLGRADDATLKLYVRPRATGMLTGPSVPASSGPERQTLIAVKEALSDAGQRITRLNDISEFKSAIGELAAKQKDLDFVRATLRQTISTTIPIEAAATKIVQSLEKPVSQIQAQEYASAIQLLSKRIQRLEEELEVRTEELQERTEDLARTQLEFSRVANYGQLIQNEKQVEAEVGEKPHESLTQPNEMEEPPRPRKQRNTRGGRQGWG